MSGLESESGEPSEDTGGLGPITGRAVSRGLVGEMADEMPLIGLMLVVIAALLVAIFRRRGGAQ